jgi:hypothetical protein
MNGEVFWARVCFCRSLNEYSMRIYMVVPLSVEVGPVFWSVREWGCVGELAYWSHGRRCGATGVTILSRRKFGPVQIMGVSGHRSVSSLSVYQRVNTDEKVEMGRALGASLMPQQQLALHSSERPKLQRRLAPSSTVTRTSDLPHTESAGDLLCLTESELDDLLCDMPEPPAMTPPARRFPLGQIQQNLASLAPGNMPVLINCSIGNIQIINQTSDK